MRSHFELSWGTFLIEQQGFERVVSFALATRPGDPIQRRLVLEDDRTRQAFIGLLTSGDEAKVATGLDLIKAGGQALG